MKERYRISELITTELTKLKKKLPSAQFIPNISRNKIKK